MSHQDVVQSILDSKLWNIFII